MQMQHCSLNISRLFKASTMILRCSRRLISSRHGNVQMDFDSTTGIATLELCKAPVNSMDSAMLASCTEAIKFVEKERDIRGALVKSKFNGKVFCAGLDITEFHQKSASYIHDYWGFVQDWYIAWYGCKKPTAAVINGHSPALGCVLALSCDYRVMQSGAGKTIGVTGTRVGLSIPFFVVELLVGVIGHRAAEHALLSGALYSAEEAKNMGLVDEIDELNKLTPVATRRLQELISVPSAAYTYTKMQLRQNIINRLIRVKQEDCHEYTRYVMQPAVQAAIANYLSSLKARKK